LKGKKFSVFTAVSAEELDDFWTTLLSIDEEFAFSRSDKFSAKELSSKLVKFIGVFVKLNHLPDPVPGPEDHYKKFSEVFGTKTTE